eukprot:9012057-Karenia_brevis.AAC.1
MTPKGPRYFLKHPQLTGRLWDTQLFPGIKNWLRTCGIEEPQAALIIIIIIIIIMVINGSSSSSS